MRNYDLDILGLISPELALMEAASEVRAKIEERFGKDFEIAEGPIASPEKRWTHEIKIRRGNKIGAAIEFTWHHNAPSVLHLDAVGASKLGSVITYVVVTAFSVAGMFLAYNDIAPLAFLPGKKLAGGLGGALFMLPGAIGAYFLKQLALKGVRSENEQLLEEVRDFLATL